MTTDESKRRWDELRILYGKLPRPIRGQALRIFAQHHGIGMDRVQALEFALMAVGHTPVYAMDGAQEYEDTLAGNEIYETLKEG